MQQNDELAKLISGSGLSPAARSYLNTIASSPIDEVSARSSLYAETWPRLNPVSLDKAFANLIENTLYRGVGIATALSDYNRDIIEVIN